MAGDATVLCTTKLPLFAKRRRWGVAMRVHHPSDARLLCRDDDGRRNHQTCDGAAVAMVGSRKSRGTYLVLKSKKAQRTNVRTQLSVRRAIDDAIDRGTTFDGRCAKKTCCAKKTYRLEEFVISS